MVLLAFRGSQDEILDKACGEAGYCGEEDGEEAEGLGDGEVEGDNLGVGIALGY